MTNTCSGCSKKKWFENKSFLAALVLALLCALSYIFPILEPFKKSLLMYLGKIWWAVLLGFILGGAIDHFVLVKKTNTLLVQNTITCYSILH